MVEVFSGKVEIGQGILTAIAQIVADELDIDLARVRMMPASTAASPNEGVTSGSYSVEHSGSALRYACAEARAIFLDAAAQRLGVAASSLSVREDGTIAGPGNLRTSYWELGEVGLLDRDATARVAPKPASARQIAGTAAGRIDIPDKVFGRPRFVHDLALPGTAARAHPAPAVARRDADRARRRQGEGRARRRGGGARRQLRRRRRRDGGRRPPRA